MTTQTVAPDRTTALRAFASPLNLHIAVVALFLVLNIFLAVKLILVGSSTGDQGDAAIVNAQARVAAADLAARPLRGLDTKLQSSGAEATRFYNDRLPFAYSDVATQLGVLATRTNVRLSRAQYVQSVPQNDVTELRVDAAVTGDYRSLALFINGLERSHTFFLIESIGLSGAQNGLVNLRLRLGTYLREPMPAYAVAQAASGAQP